MSQCAYRLGMAFGREAERASDVDRQLQYFYLFDRCFFAVRVATALELRLRREAPSHRTAADGDAEDLRDRAEADPPEHDRAPRERDVEYDREREPVSLPVLLRTLDGVAADAAALPGPEPAALPTLRELLAQLKSSPAPAASPRKAETLRTRLAGSATVQTPAAILAAPHSGLRGLAVRRATGPPAAAAFAPGRSELKRTAPRTPSG